MSTFTNTAREVEMPNGDIVKLHDAVTPNSTSNIKKFKYDDNGHVTESEAANATDLNLNSYSTPTSGSTDIGTSDAVQTAIGKLDHQSYIDQTNILYSLNTGAKNLFRWNKWVNDCTVFGGTKNIDADGKLILTSTTSNCYTEYEGFTYPDVEIAVKENEQYVLMWDYSRLAGGSRGIVYVVFEGSTGTTSASASAEVKKIEFTTPSGTTGLRIYINQTANGMQEQYYDFMICSKVIWDTLGHNYQPPSLPNADLTQLQSEDRAALVEQVDEGAKNLLDWGSLMLAALEPSSGTYVPQATKTDTSITVSGSWAWTRVLYGIIHLKAGTYVLAANITAASFATGTYGTIRIVDNLYASGGYMTLEVRNTGRLFAKFHIENEMDLYVVFCPNYGGIISTPNSFAATDLMICSEADWKISQNFAPFALPNSDLTQLEQQDRNALAEVVDSGAKQLMNLNDCPTTLQHNVTFTNIGENKYKINGTPDAADTYIELMGGFNTVPQFLTNNIGKTIVFSSNSDNVKYGIIPIIGGVAQTGVLGSKSNPAYYTIPNNLSGAILRIYVDTIAPFDDFVAELICYDSTIFNISPLFMPYISYSMVERYSALSSSSKTYTYTIDRSDFKTSSVGTYLIVIVTWSTSPAFSLYAVTYSGGVTTYTTLTKIAGSDATISVTDGVISVTTSGRVQILSI